MTRTKRSFVPLSVVSWIVLSLHSQPSRISTLLPLKNFGFGNKERAAQQVSLAAASFPEQRLLEFEAPGD